MMSQVTEEPVKTFTVGFETAGIDFRGYDERHDAQVVSQRFGTDHYEIVVEPRLAEILPQIIWHFDEPFANETAIPTYYLAEWAAKHVTVSLGGVGADEVFGGYPRYPAARWLSLYFRFPALLQERVLPAIVARLPEGSSPTGWQRGRCRGWALGARRNGPLAAERAERVRDACWP